MSKLHDSKKIKLNCITNSTPYALLVKWSLKILQTNHDIKKDKESNSFLVTFY